MKGSCHIWMSHTTHEWDMSHTNEPCLVWEWVMSHMNESCQKWMSHVTHEWAMSRMNESEHAWVRHVTHEWALSISTATHCNKLQSTATYCNTMQRTYEWDMSHTNEPCPSALQHTATHCNTLQHTVTYCNTLQLQHAHMNETCHTRMSLVSLYVCMSIIRMSYVTYAWVMSRMNESCHVWISHVTYECHV